MSIFIRSHSRVSARALTAVSFVSLASVAGNALAENTMPPVVVTAARIEQSQADALPHTTVISSDTIRNSQAIDVPTLLRNEAGLQFTQSGGPGQLASFFLRGASPSQTLILIDGVPVRREGFSGSAALEHILPEQIDHIEIVRGNVSAIYGSGAIGGVIQIFTRQGNRTPVIGASVEAGSRGTIKVTGDLAGQSDGTRYAVSASRFRTDGFSAMNTTQFPNENPNKNGYDNTSASVSLSQQWAKGHEAGIRLYANEGNFTYDGGGFGAPTDLNKGTSRQQSLALFSRDKLTSAWTSNLTVSQTRTSNRDISISAYGYDSLYDSTANLLQWNNEFALAPDWTLTAGADFGHEKANVTNNDGFSIMRNAPSRSTASVFAGVSGKIDAHQLQVNARHDQVDGSGSKTTGYLGYGYVLTPALKLVASASTAFNAPTLAQVYDPDNGNINLKPETSRSVEAGAQYAVAGTLVRATVFKTRTKDQFGIDPDNCFSGAYLFGCPTFNIAQATNRGFELSASGQLASVDLKTSLTLQEPVNDATHQILIRRARTLASVSAAQAFGALRVGADVQYSGNRNDGSNALGGYVLANLNARYALSKSVSLFARVDNLFDRNYQTAYGYNQPPRGVFAGLRWQQ
ncbi:TonB-dependent receptor plug domain-containing protein [Actimicrobium sp. CCI2.3]|uniref:TonB-dependent receptor plug domain-containing protein n=1 Tax=Actimicrobium sp. CCI2.3 TaxID=3048616 RepID=UPI002AB441A5|nr:TonB-dependent receptor [Actimicrobium sp. CCI2.3]MDY7573880.1 TonB-dependent receptor [Actimicrobium sp. CCI2.3]MEB0023398.1 TonB-dependent receptor [Actimicrobium sp. CCI2.3]